MELYTARDGYRWRIKHRNGRIIAVSSEAYTRELSCCKSLYRLLAGMAAMDYAFVEL